MTKIEIFMDSEGSYSQIVCMGHTGYAAQGDPDILCAAVSILVIGTMNALEELAGERFDAVQEQESGFMKFDFSTAKPLQEKSVFLLDAMVYNLKQLSREYGKQFLQVEFKEV